MILADSAIEMSGTVAEAALVLVLLWRRAFLTLPIFSFYIAYGFLSDVGQSAAVKHYPAAALHIYVISTAIDSLFQFGVLVELSVAVLRPMKQLLPRWTPFAIAGVIALICAAIWPFEKSPVFTPYKLDESLLLHLQQTFSILRILFFLTLAGCSQLLSIGWRDRELQIATGLGFYSMVTMAAFMLHSRSAFFAEYHLIDQLATASYVCSLLYWVYSFAQQEATRREFTPQMQSFLLAVAGSAHSTRMAMSDSSASKDRDRRE